MQWRVIYTFFFCFPAFSAGQARSMPRDSDIFVWLGAAASLEPPRSCHWVPQPLLPWLLQHPPPKTIPPLSDTFKEPWYFLPNPYLHPFHTPPWHACNHPTYKGYECRPPHPHASPNPLWLAAVWPAAAGEAGKGGQGKGRDGRMEGGSWCRGHHPNG